MNKNMVYVALLAVLCVLAGVVVGAGITKRAALPWPCPGKPNFSERAELFMGHGPKGGGEKHFMRHGQKDMGGKKDNGPLEMLITKLELTENQQGKVKGVLEKMRREIDEVGKNVRSSITEIKEKGDKQIMDMLTTEQQQKFKALLDEFKEKRGFAGHGRDRGPMREHGPFPGEELPPPQDE